MRAETAIVFRLYQSPLFSQFSTASCLPLPVMSVFAFVAFVAFASYLPFPYATTVSSLLLLQLPLLLTNSCSFLYWCHLIAPMLVTVLAGLFCQLCFKLAMPALSYVFIHCHQRYIIVRFLVRVLFYASKPALIPGNSFKANL